MLYFVGLDLSLTGTGVTIIDATGVIIATKVFGYPLKKTATELEKISRVIDIVDGIMQLVRKYKDNTLMCSLERPAYSAKGRQNDLSELQGVLKVNLWLAFSIISKLETASHVRKKVLGKGKLTKKQIMAEIKAQYKYILTNDNIADAFVLAECLRQETVNKDEQQSLFTKGEIDFVK